jgi:hypothetical protein
MVQEELKAKEKQNNTFRPKITPYKSITLIEDKKKIGDGETNISHNSSY